MERSSDTLSEGVFKNIAKFAMETLHVDPKVFEEGPKGGKNKGKIGGPAAGGDHDPTMDTHDPTAPEHQGDGAGSKAQVAPQTPTKVNKADSGPPPSGPQQSGPPPSGPQQSGAQPSGLQQCGPPPSGAQPSGAQPSVTNGNEAEAGGQISNVTGSSAPPANPPKGGKAF